MAAGQNGHAAAVIHGQVEHLIGQTTASMDRGKQGARRDFRILNFSFDVADAPLEARPVFFQGRQQGLVAGWLLDIDAGRRFGGIVQNDQDGREQAMAGRQFDNGSAPHQAPDAFCRFPGFEEFLTGEACGFADRTGDFCEEGVAGEMIQIAGEQEAS